MKHNVKNEIKSYIARSGMSMKGIVEEWNRRNPEEQTTAQNIANKLSRGTIKHSEVLEIADIIGYRIDWTEK